MRVELLPKRQRKATAVARSALAISGAGLLLLSCGFTSGAWWNQRQAEGSTICGRACLPSADEVVAKQIMARLYEDSALTIASLREEAKRDDIRGVSARGYLHKMRDRIGK